MEVQLARLLQRKIVVIGPRLLTPENGEDRLVPVTLLGVEPAGIWVASDDAANHIASRFHVKPAAPSAFFIPFAQITTILAGIESPAEAPLSAA